MKKNGMHYLPDRRYLLKIILTMKFIVVLMLLSSMQLSAKVFAQQLSIQVKNVTFKEVAREIERQTELTFLYSDVKINELKNLSLDFHKTDVATILEKCLEGSELSYKIVENTVVIVPAVSKAMVPRQKQLIHGVVKDQKGELLPGVSVMIKGTTVGVVTNSQGYYEIIKPEQEPVMLVFSFIGMKTMTVQYKGQESLNVVMEEEAYMLDEAVVQTGYQTIDRRHLTSAITSVRAEDVLVPGMTSIDQALEGRIPDLLLMSNSGEVGATPRIRVRGTSTILGNREPLWVLDGIVLKDPVDLDPGVLNDPDYINVVGNAIAGINPQDIARIDVLKDASATAIYGTSAANGVIVITTKRGQLGKARISYSHTSKLTQRPRYSDRNIYLMNSQERVQFGKDLVNGQYTFPASMPLVGYEGAWYRLQVGQSNYTQFLEEVENYETTNTDWFDILTRDAYSHSHTLSISGGSEDIRYYSSIAYNRENGVSQTTYSNRYSVMLNLDATITPRFKASLRFNGNVRKQNNLIAEINAMDYSYNTTRALPCYQSDGSFYFYDKSDAYDFTSYPPEIGTGKRYNILNEIENSSNTYDGNTIMATVDLDYTFFEGLRVTAMGSYSRSNTLQKVWWGEKTNYIARLRNAEYDEIPLENENGNCLIPYGGILNTNNSISENMTFRLQANYNQYFGLDRQHLAAATFGYEVNTSKMESIGDEDRGFLKDRGLQFVTFTSEELDKFPHYKQWLSENKRRLRNNLTNKLSGFLTLTYGYKEYFTLNVNGRFDASNQFGSRSNERFLPIWSVSGMWNMMNTFLPESNWLSDARLRISYGQQGNMVDGQTPNMLIRKGNTSTFYGENISTLYSFPNPNLKWEVSKQVNLGLDFAFFDGRLNVQADFYTKHTTDLFADINVASVNGVSAYKMNNGDMNNRGFSIVFSGDIIRTKNMKWYSSAFYSVNRNKVEAQPVENYGLDQYLSGTAIIPGEAIGSFYSYKFLGLNPRNGTPMFDDYQDRQHLLQGKMLNQIVAMVMEKSGTREPIFSGNWNHSISWKGLNLSFNLAYSLGSKVRLFNLFSPMMSGVSAENNVRKEFINRWMVPGDEQRTNIPVLMSPADPEYGKYRFHYSSIAGWEQVTNAKRFADNVWQMYDNSDIRVVSGNYLKMQSLSLRYNFSQNLLRKTPFGSASISLSSMNLFTISARSLKGQDPSQAGFAKPNLSVRPTYTLGLNVSF